MRADRFIPTVLPSQYNRSPSITIRRDRQLTSFSEPRPFIDTLLIDQYLNEVSSASSSEGGGDITSGQAPTSPTTGGITNENQFYLAAALGQSSSDRVLTWESPATFHSTHSVVSPGNTSIFSLPLPNSGEATEGSTNSPSTSSSTMTFNRLQSSRTSPPRANSERRQVYTMGSGMGVAGTDYPMVMASLTISEVPDDSKKVDICRNLPYRLLDAPLLRNDYYANLISWSHQCGKVAVGLGNEVYLWHEQEGASLLQISGNRSAIMCVTFNTVNDLLMIGCRNGMIYIADAPKDIILAKYDHRSTRRGNSLECGVCSALWVPNRNDLLIIGDESGYTGVLGIKTVYDNDHEIHGLAELGGHFQQICGMASPKDGSEIAIGCNDNSCSIWDISCLQDYNWTQDIELTLKHTLVHNAAVKAMAYCPWSPSLLATGGGSHDRTIRFWHTGTGTLIKKIPVHAQVTSIFWSRFNRQFVATFGFSDPGRGSLISVFTFPELELRVQVTSKAGLRFLSASQSANDGQVAVTSNDETVRFYEVWPVVAGAVPMFPKSGIFGSDLIELIEGIERPEAVIR
ncbi:WD40-repeat-containing domain protein [Yarrowia lipolytica]|jgi:meiosis-specific APC/C activator protein AMA1|uniref:YALI0B17270p n=2 Tax=Yarrowia lipolytica TaxID=4952 RepID=Q6CEA3_YARLI|nr:YALI0B17270p [Yarrowia lipolytica CLIB122]AOW01831.1 hypothetical protein YALI1_B22452g [Yarrowia lipolytica]KAB8285066.1 WD40-repeat-containing domain protein [Yarrowia lipolytica]KAE8175010.1 WD40-repeat-containing domain protein [Yarrowia lipolytica]KAJ8052622.1 WD40-repeat-containing domain protein [Yarrowia lipolytica]RDW24792.1 WD40-repeat-containing domain protein [Yarrowia lipolytica]|eukprot:XP_501009.1 YALI0B17270p [Yarrowia lipolytica CLIB122]